MNHDRPSAPRRYKGASAETRKAERRDRLLDAAIMVYGERGFRNSTVQSVCDAAGLTKRYFYESYQDSEALLVDCFRAVVGSLLDELREATAAPSRDRAQSILLGYYTALQSDPTRARLFLLETDGIGPAVFAAMREAQGQFADLLVPGSGGGVRDHLQRIGAVAGVARISAHWIAGDYKISLDDVVASTLNLFGGLLDQK